MDLPFDFTPDVCEPVAPLKSGQQVESPLCASVAPQMLGELVAAGLGPDHVDSLYELYEKVRAAEQEANASSPPGMPR